MNVLGKIIFSRYGSTSGRKRFTWIDANAFVKSWVLVRRPSLLYCVTLIAKARESCGYFQGGSVVAAPPCVTQKLKFCCFSGHLLDLMGCGIAYQAQKQTGAANG